MDIVDKGIDRYIEELYYYVKDPVREEMERLADARDFPIVGPQVGRLLFMLAKAVKAKRIFEMGSGFGYSAYWFAKSLPADGKIYLTEGSKENSKLAQEFFKRGGIEKKAEFLVGDAKKLIDQVKGDFDIVFIDIHKDEYPAAYRKAKDRVRKGGFLLADNVLWFGRVLEEVDDPETVGIKIFTRLLFDDPHFYSNILPIRDGIAMAYRQ